MTDYVEFVKGVASFNEEQDVPFVCKKMQMVKALKLLEEKA